MKTIFEVILRLWMDELLNKNDTLRSNNSFNIRRFIEEGVIKNSEKIFAYI